MSAPIYEIPDNADDFFSNGPGHQYRIIDHSAGMDMDNIESLTYFLECCGLEAYVIEDEGTRATLRHPDYPDALVIDSGGLGDFFSHGFDVSLLDN